jgi:hypothetical protein
MWGLAETDILASEPAAAIHRCTNRTMSGQPLMIAPGQMGGPIATTSIDEAYTARSA